MNVGNQPGPFDKKARHNGGLDRRSRGGSNRIAMGGVSIMRVVPFSFPGRVAAATG